MVRISDTMKQQNDLTTFPVAYAADLWLDKNKGSGTPNYASIQTLYNNGELGGGATEVTTMPTASEDYLGNIVQYVGENGTYKKGHFYECIHNVTNVNYSYEWQELSHFRFNRTVYSMTTEPINSDFVAGDVIYYTGEKTENFNTNHFYRALPNATPQTVYQVNMKETAIVGVMYDCNTPFELRVGFIVFPSVEGGESTPYQITEITDESITLTPYGWSGDERTYIGASYSTTVLGWEELEGGGGTSIFYGTMEEWNALPADEKKQYDYMADNNAGGSYIDTYSTTETKTNKVWVDNKPIYRKCWSGLNIGTNETSIGTINNLDTVVNIEASISQYTTTSATTLAFKKPYVRSQANVDVKSNGVFCKSGSGFDRINVVVVEYTKTN